jgi:hypothetical protein
VAVDVALPPGREAWFQATLALDPAAWAAPSGDGVEYRVEVARLGGAPGAEAEQPATVALDRTLNPRARVEDRRWVPVVVDLSPWAGETVRLRLRTLPRDDLAFDWSGWGNPVVFVRESARAYPPPDARPNS